MTFCNMHLSNYIEYQDLFQYFISILRQLHCNKKQHIYNNIIANSQRKTTSNNYSIQIILKSTFHKYLAEIMIDWICA